MEQEEKKPTTLTGVDLSQTASLLLPWTHDPWGKLRPPLSEEALCMSAELASAAYGMAIEPWVEAGWRDVTIQGGWRTDCPAAEQPLERRVAEILGARAPETRQRAGTDVGCAAIEQQQ